MSEIRGASATTSSATTTGAASSVGTTRTPTRGSAGGSPSASTVPSAPLERAFRILQELVAAGEPVGVRELGRRCGLPRSTASRLVAQLDALAFVQRDADGRITPGSALATLQLDGGARPLLRDRFRPLLVDLTDRFGEHAALSIDDGAAVSYLAQIRSDHPVSAPDVTDARHPFHLVAPGLLCMAHWPRDRLDAYLGQPLHASTEHSITDPIAVAERVTGIAETGFAWAEQELDIGISGLAVPILDRGALVAAVSMFGPSYRFSPSLRPELASELAAIVTARADGEQSR